MRAIDQTERWTVERIQALPYDGQRHEAIHGELFVTPSPRVWHAIVTDRITQALKDYLIREPVGYALNLEADISWGDDTLVKPDIFVAPLEQLRTLDWQQVQSLLLVVEVLSPSSHRVDRFVKRKLYQDVHIPLYWVIDADARLVECWTPDASAPRLERNRLVWHPAGASEACKIELSLMFAPL